MSASRRASPRSASNLRLQLQQELDEPRTVDRVTLSDLGEMDAVFATNAAIGLRAVSAIEDREFPEQHPVLDTLRGLYADIPGETV